MGTQRRTVIAILGVIALTAASAATLAIAQSRQEPAAQSSVVAAAFPDDGSLMPTRFAGFSPSTGDETILPSSPYSARWALVTKPAPGDTSLDVAYVSGPGTECGKHFGFVVTETDTSITLASATSPAEIDEPAIADGSSAHPFVGCTAEGHIGHGTVPLASPIGSREILHAGLSVPWDAVPGDLLGAIPAAPASDIPACTADQLSARVSGSGGAGGSLFQDLVLTNETDDECVLSGFPTVTFLALDVKTGTTAQHQEWDGEGTVELSAGGTAAVRLTLASTENYTTDSCGPVAAQSLEITLPSSDLPLAAPWHIDVCSNSDVQQLAASGFLAERSTKNPGWQD